jgi:mannitol-1-phosphate 5-dehydrogenase
MSSMQPPVVIFGAGRTGRGLVARIMAQADRPVVLVDRDRALVDRLAAAGAYPIDVIGAGITTIRPAAVLHLDDPAWEGWLAQADLAFTAVVGTNLAGLGQRLGPVLARRQGGPLAIITCENDAGAARTLASAAGLAAGPGLGWVEAMVLTTCLAPEAGEDPLLVRSQDLLRLPCDRAAFPTAPPTLAGLEPLPAFANQLKRKIWTYNAINAVISYLGAERGHTQLAAASTDPAIAAIARAAVADIDRALVAEFAFDPAEQAQWSAAALAKFADPRIHDPIARNAADPARKLRPDDRLIAPARLCLRHGIQPTALASAIRAAARYRDPGQPSPLERHGSLAAVLEQVCGLRRNEPLFALISQG